MTAGGHKNDIIYFHKMTASGHMAVKVLTSLGGINLNIFFYLYE